MQSSRTASTAALGLVGLAWLALSASGTVQAYEVPRRRASWEWRHRSRTVVVLPADAIPIRAVGGPSYYCRGRYYRRGSDGYVLIAAPIGAVVPALPAEHRTVVIDGVTYHEYDGVYYKGGPAGYTVVPIAQVPATAGTTLASAQAAPVIDHGALVINVPNRNGSYTPVTLHPSGNGMYIGPQGEVYPNAPTAQQLQGLYGK